jgi:hypothetical protein
MTREVAWRAASPSVVDLITRLESLDPKVGGKIYEDAWDAVGRAIWAALTTVEALQHMPATPETNDSPGREEKLAQVVKRVRELGFMGDDPLPKSLTSVQEAARLQAIIEVANEAMRQRYHAEEVARNQRRAP